MLLQKEHSTTSSYELPDSRSDIHYVSSGSGEDSSTRGNHLSGRVYCRVKVSDRLYQEHVVARTTSKEQFIRGLTSKINSKLEGK